MKVKLTKLENLLEKYSSSKEIRVMFTKHLDEINGSEILVNFYTFKRMEDNSGLVGSVCYHDLRDNEFRTYSRFLFYDPITGEYEISYETKHKKMNEENRMSDYFEDDNKMKTEHFGVDKINKEDLNKFIVDKVVFSSEEFEKQIEEKI